MRSLAYIQTIQALKPIQGADKIECAEVLGWEVVVKKGDFQVGDKAVYVEIDSILPDLPVFEFLRPKKFRIKTVRLRGQISQGLVLPLSILKEVDPTIDLDDLQIDQDVSDNLRITKYDPEATLDTPIIQPRKSWLANRWSYLKWKLFGIKPKKGNRDFPADVPKTDEVRVQKMGSLLWQHQGELVYLTEKLEGSSATFIYRGGGNWLAKLLGKDHHFQVCSRNRVVYDSGSGGERDHYLVQLAVKYNLLPAFQKLNRNLAVQAESLGPKIQGNIYQLLETDLRVFLVYDLDTKKYLPYQEAIEVASQLGLPFVPVLETMAPLVNGIKHYVELSKGKSQMKPEIDREGIVIRAMDGSFSFKSINPEYLLKQD